MAWLLRKLHSGHIYANAKAKLIYRISGYFEGLYIFHEGALNFYFTDLNFT